MVGKQFWWCTFSTIPKVNSEPGPMNFNLDRSRHVFAKVLPFLCSDRCRFSRVQSWLGGTQIPTKWCGTNCSGTRSMDAVVCPICLPSKRALEGYSMIFHDIPPIFLEFPYRLPSEINPGYTLTYELWELQRSQVRGDFGGSLRNSTCSEATESYNSARIRLISSHSGRATRDYLEINSCLCLPGGYTKAGAMSFHMIDWGRLCDFGGGDVALPVGFGWWHLQTCALDDRRAPGQPELMNVDRLSRGIYHRLLVGGASVGTESQIVQGWCLVEFSREGI